MNRRIRPVLIALVVFSLLFTAAALLARTQPIANIPGLILAVGSPYVPLGALVGLVVAASCRQVLLTLLAAAVLAASLGVQVSWYYLGRSAEVVASQDIRVLSSNLRYGEADPDFIVSLAKENADVITFSELTAEAVYRLKQSGLEATFPYSNLDPKPDAGGIGLWSRYPIDGLSALRTQPFILTAGRLRVPGLRFEPLLASLHVQSPLTGGGDTVDEWREGMARAKTQLDSFASTAGPGAVIIGGDFNSTPDLRQFRDLQTNGYEDAVRQSGSGFAPTFPSNRRIPPVITIDHVLTRNAAASEVRTITVPGSDHRALLATIRVPIDPTAS